MRASSHSRRDGPSGGNTTAMPHSADRSNSRTPAVAPSFGSPVRDHSSPRPSRSMSSAALELGRMTPPGTFCPIDRSIGAAGTTDVETSRLESPTSAPPSQSDGDEYGGDFAIGAYTGGAKLRDGGLEDDATRISSWGTSGLGTGDNAAAMSWVAGEGDGGGRITPKTALRFKTSALSRAMHR